MKEVLGRNGPELSAREIAREKRRIRVRKTSEFIFSLIVKGSKD